MRCRATVCQVVLLRVHASAPIYTLSLHDALPISTTVTDQDGGFRFNGLPPGNFTVVVEGGKEYESTREPVTDRKSTRLNSSHITISYAVFCLKKKKRKITSRHSV